MVSEASKREFELETVTLATSLPRWRCNPANASSNKACCKVKSYNKSLNYLSKLNGHVIVPGCGVTVFDCATSAIRCEVSKVLACFRRGLSHIRVVPEAMSFAVEEKCEFMPFRLAQENDT